MTAMKLTLKHFNLRSLDTVDSWVEQQILALGQFRLIDEANVRLAHMQESSPPYRVHVHLVTPGPDVFVEGRDHTLRAAFGKVMTQLRDKLTGRATKRARRLKNGVSIKAALARPLTVFR